jgi:hypothetical protein
MQVFTSVTVNYIPKARVLAASLKRFHPDAKFHLVLSDAIPDELRQSPAPFDRILHVEELPIENVRKWIFKHTLVELCTAVKGPAAQMIMAEHPAEELFYFDPDIVILAPLDPLQESLRRHDVVLTPHQTGPDHDPDAILDNEVCSLKHGVYNLGFLGLAPTAEGRRFADWWAERLRLFCRAEIENGLFTDQRWADLTPAFFPTVGILREPGYNVATWNLTTRPVTGTSPFDLYIHDQRLVFYHFSGFDSGAQKTMLDKFGSEYPALYDLREWYIAQCAAVGQNELGNARWHYGFFNNGERITDYHRKLYRSRLDVQRYFPQPFDTDDVSYSYYHWFQQEVPGGRMSESVIKLQEEVAQLRRENATLARTNETLQNVNNTLGMANESLLKDNATLSSTIANLQAGNVALAQANAALVTSNGALTATNATLTSTSQAILAGHEASVESLRQLQAAHRLLEEQSVAWRHELEAIRNSRSYRAARRVSNLVHGVWRRTA